MDGQPHINRRWFAVASAAGVLSFTILVWQMWPVASREPAALPVVEAAPLPVYVTPESNPQAALIGTDSSISTDSARLQLFATSPGKSPREGTAVLGISATNPQTYAVGAVLASGAMIEEIHADYVVLLHRAGRSKLYRVGFAAQMDDALSAATTVGGPGISDRPVETRETSQEDYVDFLKAKLVFEDDKLSGFEIDTGAQVHRLANLGLERGDVIRSIDGNPVTSGADWQRIAKALRSGGSVVLGVERQGAAISVLMNASRIGTELPRENVEVQAPVAPPFS